MSELFNSALLSPAEAFARAHRATASGMSLDLLAHGDVAVLRTPEVEIMFLSGVPAAYFDKKLGSLFVSDDLKLGSLSWHREQIADYWKRRPITWTSQIAIFSALRCRREHEPKCNRSHDVTCKRRHFERCTKLHRKGPQPRRERPFSGERKLLLDRSK
jgi:hypothetical protein